MDGSARPWQTTAGGGSVLDWDVNWIVDCIGDRREVNAALIVRAVNSHDDMVALCEKLLNPNTSWKDEADLRRAARAALDKATGGGE